MKMPNYNRQNIYRIIYTHHILLNMVLSVVLAFRDSYVKRFTRTVLTVGFENEDWGIFIFYFFDSYDL